MVVSWDVHSATLEEVSKILEVEGGNSFNLFLCNLLEFVVEVSPEGVVLQVKFVPFFYRFSDEFYYCRFLITP